MGPQLGGGLSSCCVCGCGRTSASVEEPGVPLGFYQRQYRFGVANTRRLTHFTNPSSWFFFFLRKNLDALNVLNEAPFKSYTVPGSKMTYL